MPDGQHLACGSRDVIRMWDLKAQEDSRSLPYKVATTAHSGTISSLRECITSRRLQAKK